MMKKVFFITIVILAFATQANAVTIGDFEGGLLDGWRLNDWEANNGSVSVSSTAGTATSGSNSLALAADAGYTSATVIDRATGDPSVKDWGNWVGTEPDALRSFTLDLTGYDFSGSTDWFQINISVQNNAGLAGGNFYFDNIQLVPEPATMMLLGLGGLIIRRKRS